ncbi:hypothetical protein OROHE_008717 [Orobanche hederae]
MKAALMPGKVGSNVRPKSTSLEKAIIELEKIVELPSAEVQDPDNPSPTVKRRLPSAIKQKLAKVASYGKIPMDVINRLMSIVGHLIQINTLKVRDVIPYKLVNDSRLWSYKEVLRGSKLQHVERNHPANSWKFNIHGNTLGYLHEDRLAGSIIAKLGNMTKLHYLNIANNHFEGPTPDNLSFRTNLNGVNVHGNKLSGSVPLAVQNLESMAYLNVHGNKLSGSVPLAFQNLESMTYIDLSNNRLSDHMPSSHGDLEHLLKHNLGNNDLSGIIPAEFGNLRSVMDIDLSNNHLSGPIPHELSQLQNVFLL